MPKGANEFCKWQRYGTLDSLDHTLIKFGTEQGGVQKEQEIVPRLAATSHTALGGTMVGCGGDKYG